MTQYRNVPTQIDALQFTGANHAELHKWGAPIVSQLRDESIIVQQHDGTELAVAATDWLIKGVYGFTTMTAEAFSQTFVRLATDDELAVTYRMQTADGVEVRATIEGWTEGKDAVRAMMHVGRPEVVLEFVKERVVAGDLSMLTLMNELAELANPGE